MIENMELDRLILPLALLHRNLQCDDKVQVLIALERMDSVLWAILLSSKVQCAKVLCANLLLHIIQLHIVRQLMGQMII